jgi:hypothetical protein
VRSLLAAQLLILPTPRRRQYMMDDGHVPALVKLYDVRIALTLPDLLLT